jgi:hypothetical protein
MNIPGIFAGLGQHQRCLIGGLFLVGKDLKLDFKRFTTGGTFATGLDKLDGWLADFKPTVSCSTTAATGPALVPRACRR